MFASTLFADENDVRDFNLQVENLLRIGRSDEAAAILETALRELGPTRHPVAALCLACPVVSIGITGWDKLAERLERFDQSGAPIVALGVDIAWPGHTGLEADVDGCLAPALETNYYTADAFPFASADRAALVEGYASPGAGWQGRIAEFDNLLGVRGLEHIYGMVQPLTESIAATPEPDAVEADAMRLGAAFMAVRLHQAVARAIRLHGLPRPLAVIVGSNESYPHFDAPVFSTAESQSFVRAAIKAGAGDAGLDEAGPVDALPTEAVLSDVETPEPERPQPEAVAEVDLAREDETVVQISGASLRQRLGRQAIGQESAGQTVAAGGLLRRLFSK